MAIQDPKFRWICVMAVITGEIDNKERRRNLKGNKIECMDSMTVRYNEGLLPVRIEQC